MWLDRWPKLIAFLAGVFLASGLPPVHLLAAPLAFALLLLLADRSSGAWSAFTRGWLFGLGFFLAGLYWIGIAFFADAERFGALALPAVVGLSAFLAIIPGLATLFFSLLSAFAGPLNTLQKSCILAVFWIGGELIRGPFGLWFPWNPVASIWGSSPWIMQSIAWIGPYLLGALTVIAGGLFAGPIMHRSWRSWLAPVSVVLSFVVLAGAGHWRIASTPLEPATGFQLRVIQANIDQHHKWDRDKIRQWFFRHVDLSTTHTLLKPDVIIWPESSVPYRLEMADTRLAITNAMPFDSHFLMGSDFFAQRETGRLLHNSLYLMSPDGELSDRYDKVDLVPFGEFLPARSFLTALGLEKLTPGSTDFTPGPGRRTIKSGELPAYSALICYEAIFPAMASPRDDRPDWLVNVTNDAWFGKSSGPYQHLTMARMRAIEEGVPLVRAANTGVSVVTDAFGRVVEGLELGETGIIDAELPPKTTQSPWFRDAPWTITGTGLILVSLIGALNMRGRAAVRKLVAK